MAKQLYSTLLPEVFKNWLEFYDYIQDEGHTVEYSYIVSLVISYPPKPDDIMDGTAKHRFLRGTWDCNYILTKVAEELLAARLPYPIIHKFQMGLAQLPVVLPEVYEGINKLYKVQKMSKD